MNDEDECSWYLGMHVEQKPGEIRIHQKYGVSQAAPVKTPLAKRSSLSNSIIKVWPTISFNLFTRWRRYIIGRFWSHKRRENGFIQGVRQWVLFSTVKSTLNQVEKTLTVVQLINLSYRKTPRVSVQKSAVARKSGS
jgi:hypothetical protein